MSHSVILPAIWLIVLVVGLPQLSETVYTPSLPDIAHDLMATESMVEYTLTIYLLGFAIGTFFWGKFSDKWGRKPCVIAGLVIFILGCIGCFSSESIELLMASRFVQALGGSIGSVLGQAICRDAFHGAALGKAYSSIGSALALFPSLGPVVGGVIAQYFGWSSIFIFLIIFAIMLLAMVAYKLPETHPVESRQKHSPWKIATALVLDRKVLAYGLIVGACNGILFSYFAEGSFYLIELLGLSPSIYGATFIMVGGATMLGGIFSKRLHGRFSSEKIMQYGLRIILVSAAIFAIIATVHSFVFSMGLVGMAVLAILCQMAISFGICVATSNALALALVDYKHSIGTASSLFGFFYYFWISLFTFFMGLLHNGTLLPMPTYFFGLGVFMILVCKILLSDRFSAKNTAEASASISKAG